MLNIKNSLSETKVLISKFKISNTLTLFAIHFAALLRGWVEWQRVGKGGGCRERGS